MKTFLAVFNAFPAILESVQTIESAIPLPQAGALKLNLILSAAAAAWEIGSTVEQTLSKANTASAVTALASTAVTSLNAAGVFTQSAPAATTAAAAPVSSN